MTFNLNRNLDMIVSNTFTDLSRFHLIIPLSLPWFVIDVAIFDDEPCSWEEVYAAYSCDPVMDDDD